jgi:hypothetical protein
MSIPQQLAENDGVLRYVGDGLEPRDVPVVAAPADVDRWRLGAHPDIVERLWDILAAALPEPSAHLVAGGAALVHPRSGLILAVALGTQYAVRLTGTGLAEAVAAGYPTHHEFALVGRTLDLERTFGPGWVFGRHDMREPEWLAESYSAANL